MVTLTEATRVRIQALFPSHEHEAVESLLEIHCGNNLPLYSDATPEKLERIRFAVLKLSEGSFEKLQKAVDLACRDWRDVLVGAGFGHDITAHKSWFPTGCRVPHS